LHDAGQVVGYDDNRAGGIDAIRLLFDIDFDNPIVEPAALLKTRAKIITFHARVGDGCFFALRP
jgi:hypothetical protein